MVADLLEVHIAANGVGKDFTKTRERWISVLDSGLSGPGSNDGQRFGMQTRRKGQSGIVLAH